MFPFHLIQAVRHCIHRQKADRHFQTLLNWQLTYIKMPSFSGESIYLNTHSHTQKNTLTHPHIQTPKYPRSLSLSNHTHTHRCLWSSTIHLLSYWQHIRHALVFQRYVDTHPLSWILGSQNVNLSRPKQ